MISTILSSRSLIYPSASVILLLITSSVLFISVCSLVLLGFGKPLLHLLHSVLRSWIILTIIILNSFPERLPLSTSFIFSFSGVLYYPFNWDVTFYFFIILINFL